MKRRVFTILSAVSLVLAVVVATAWVRSYWVSDTFSFRSPSISLYAWTWPGGFGVERNHHLRPYRNCTWETIEVSILHRGMDCERRYTSAGLTWFALIRDPDPASTSFAIVAPFWVVLLPALAFPAAWGWSRRRCRYDLRASKDKCPERGAGIEAKAG